MPATLTHFRRLRLKAREELRARMEDTIADELRRLFRTLKTRLRMLDRTKVKLQKLDIIELTMWQIFQERLHRRLMKDIREGTISVFQIEMAMVGAVLGETLQINSNNFAAQHAEELAQLVVRVSDATKRMIARKVVAWYQTPGKTFGELIADLEPRFGRPRAKLISQTELTRLNSLVQGEMAEQLGIRTWWWQTRRDDLVCTRPMTAPDGTRVAGCRGLHGRVFNVKDHKMPPDGSHPGCRCDPVLMVRPEFVAKRLIKVVREEEAPKQAVSSEMARRLGDMLGVDWGVIDLEEFRLGLEEEQEHPKLTGGDPSKVAQVALDHLKERPDYYTQLKVAMQKWEESKHPRRGKGKGGGEFTSKGNTAGTGEADKPIDQTKGSVEPTKNVRTGQSLIITQRDEVIERMADMYDKKHGFDNDHTREGFIANHQEKMKEASPEFVKKVTDAVDKAVNEYGAPRLPVVVRGRREGYNERWVHGDYDQLGFITMIEQDKEDTPKPEEFGKSPASISEVFDDPYSGVYVHEAGHAEYYKNPEFQKKVQAVDLDNPKVRDWVKKNISYYASTKHEELAAEVYALQKHPRFKELPEETQKFANGLYGKETGTKPSSTSPKDMALGKVMDGTYAPEDVQALSEGKPFSAQNAEEIATKAGLTREEKIYLHRHVRRDTNGMYEPNAFMHEVSKIHAFRVAKKRIEKEKAVEPAVTKFLVDTAKSLGAEMGGLEFRLKTEKSMTDKLMIDADNYRKQGSPRTYEQCSELISDALRYTMVFPPGIMKDGVEKTEAALAKAGYSRYDHKFKNFFTQDTDYKGINSVYVNPETGARYELQFHTPDTLRIKMTNHLLYQKNKLDTDEVRRQKRIAKMRNNWTGVTMPMFMDMLKAIKPGIRYYGEIDSYPQSERYGHLMGVFRVDQQRGMSEVWYPAENKWVFDFSVYGKVNGLEDGLSFHEISKEDVERYIERRRPKKMVKVVRFNELSKSWEESKHPRKGKGADGGQFTSKGDTAGSGGGEVRQEDGDKKFDFKTITALNVDFYRDAVKKWGTFVRKNCAGQPDFDAVWMRYQAMKADDIFNPDGFDKLREMMKPFISRLTPEQKLEYTQMVMGIKGDYLRRVGQAKIEPKPIPVVRTSTPTPAPAGKKKRDRLAKGYIEGIPPVVGHFRNEKNSLKKFAIGAAEILGMFADGGAAGSAGFDKMKTMLKDMYDLKGGGGAVNAQVFFPKQFNALLKSYTGSNKEDIKRDIGYVYKGYFEAVKQAGGSPDANIELAIKRMFPYKGKGATPEPTPPKVVPGKEKPKYSKAPMGLKALKAEKKNERKTAIRLRTIAEGLLERGLQKPLYDKLVEKLDDGYLNLNPDAINEAFASIKMYVDNAEFIVPSPDMEIDYRRAINIWQHGEDTKWDEIADYRKVVLPAHKLGDPPPKGIYKSERGEAIRKKFLGSLKMPAKLKKAKKEYDDKLEAFGVICDKLHDPKYMKPRGMNVTTTIYKEYDDAYETMKVAREAYVAERDARNQAAYDMIKVPAKKGRAPLVMAMNGIDTQNPEYQRAIKWIEDSVSPDVIKGLIRVEGTRADRAYFEEGANLIHVDPKGGWYQIPHELGHFIESRNPKVKEMCERFLRSRTHGEKLKELRKLDRFNLNPPREVAFPDNFIHPYSGKWYGTGRGGELLSQGIEDLVRMPEEFAERDPEYFNFIVDILHNELDAGEFWDDAPKKKAK